MLRFLPWAAMLALLPSFALAQGVTIPQLPPAASIGSADQVPLHQASGLHAATIQQLANAIATTGVTPTGVLLTASNLSDLQSPATARNNLGLGDLAVLGVGTGLTSNGSALAVTYGSASGTAAQGNDSRIIGALQATNNLSDVPDQAMARANLGIALFGTSASGLVPASGGGSINFLRADGTWVAPPAGGGAPSGPAGGDLSGSYPLPTVAKINGLTPAASATTDTTNAANIGSGTLLAARLPLPTATTIGGIESYAAVLHQWINSISTSGVPSSSQPAASDISGLAASATTDTTNASNISSGTLLVARGGTGASTLTPHGALLGNGTGTVGATAAMVAGQLLVGQGTTLDPIPQTVSGDAALSSAGAFTVTKTSGTPFAASATIDTTNASNVSSGTLNTARLPLPTATTLGGIESYVAVSHQWINSISTAGLPSSAQPAASDVSGLASSATIDTTNAANISSGTLLAARLPACSFSAAGSVPTAPNDVTKFLAGNCTWIVPAGGGGVAAANNGTDFTSPATTLTNLGGTGPLNLSGFWDASNVYHSIVCDGTTDQSTIVQLAAATGRDIYGPTTTQSCVFGDVSLTQKQGFFGYGMQVKAPPGARWVLSRQSTGIVAGLSGAADASAGEEAITTTSGSSAVGSNVVQAAPEATSSAATGSGTALTLGGTVAGTFVRNMTICDGGSTVLCATGLGYVVGNTLHITSSTQGQYAIGQLIETYTATPVTSITASLTTAAGDVSTWRINQSIGNIASQGSPQTVFAAMTVNSVSGSVLTMSGNVGTLGATAISGTRLELGERAAIQMSDGYRHNAFIYGLTQTASQVSLTLARNLPQTVVSGGTVWASWGMFNAGCGAQNATFRDISFQINAWTGIYSGCTDGSSSTTTINIENIQAVQGLRHFFIMLGPRVGPVLVTDARVNETWSKSYTLTGNGTAGPYQLQEPAAQRSGVGGVSTLTSGATTFTSVQSWQVLGSTNFYIDEDTYHIWFGQTIPNGQTINVTQNNLPGDEGVIVDAFYGPLQLTGRANAFNISGHGGGCQICLGVYNSIGSSPIAGVIRSWYGDPASQAMLRFDGPMQVDVQTGRLSNTTRAIVEIINKAVVTGNMVVNPQSSAANPLGALEQPFTLDPLAKFFGSWRSISRPTVNYYGSQFQFYSGTTPLPATSGLCTTTAAVPLGSYDIPCDPADTFTGYLTNNALTVLTGGTNLAVGMQINAKNQGVPNAGITISSINGGGSITLAGASSLGSIGSSGSPVSFTATTLLPGQLHVPSTGVSGYSVGNTFTITSGGSTLIAGMTLNGPGYPASSVTINSVNGGGTLTLSGASSLGSIGSSGSPVDFVATYLSSGQTANSPSTNYATTSFLPAWATIINYDGAMLHVTARVTGDGPSGIPLGASLQFSGPIQPAGSFGAPALTPYGDAAGNILYSSDNPASGNAFFNTKRQWLNSSGIVASPSQGIPTGANWDNFLSPLASSNLSIIQGAAHGVGVGGVATFFGQNSANTLSIAQGAFGCNWEQVGTNDSACGIWTRKQGGTPTLSLGVSSGGLISFPRTAGTFATKPSAASAPYTYYYASDLGPSGCMLLSNGTIWKPASGRCIIYRSNTPTTPTSSTAEANALFATIPAGIPSVNGSIELTENGVGTGTAGIKDLGVRLSSGTSPITTGGCQILNYQPAAANDSLTVDRFVWAQGSTSSQATGGVGIPGPGASGTPVNCSITTTAAWGISFNNFVVNAGDTISIADATVYWEE